MNRRKLRKLWNRIFQKKCCLNCKHYDSATVECIRKVPFSLEHYFRLVREEKIDDGDESIVGSACPSWE